VMTPSVFPLSSDYIDHVDLCGVQLQYDVLNRIVLFARDDVM
jgi:hypothetical protein